MESRGGSALQGQLKTSGAAAEGSRLWGGCWLCICRICAVHAWCVCLCALCMMWWNWALGTSSPGWLQAYVLDYRRSAGEQTAESCVRGQEEELNV